MKRLCVVLVAFLLTFSEGVQGAIQFSGSSASTTIVTTGVKQDLIDDIETALLAFGWTTISGSGTTNLLMESGTTPQGLQIRSRFRDLAGQTVKIYMENVAGTLADAITGNHGASLLPTLGRTYQVIGSEYQFVIYQTALARAFVWVGMPYLPAFMTGTITNCGWLFANSRNDTDTTIRQSIISSTSLARTTDQQPNYELMINLNYWSLTNSNDGQSVQWPGAPRLILNGITADFNASQTTQNSYRWANDSVVTGDMYIAWGRTAYTDEAKLVGQVWDALYIADAVAAGTTATFSAHDFHNVTNNSSAAASNIPRGGIWFAIN